MNTEVSSYLFGSILSLSRGDAVLSVILSLAVLALFALLYPRLFAVTFDETFARATGTRADLYNTLLAVLTAVTVVLGMMMMGALLISSLMIFPSVTAMRINKHFRGVVLTAVLISVGCFLLGLLLSLWIDTAVGASVILMNLLVFAIASVISGIRKKTAKA